MVSLGFELADIGRLWAGVRTSVPRAIVTAAPTGLPARQSLGVTLTVPYTVARRDVAEVPNVSPRSAPPTEETRELMSWLVPECCRLQRPTLVRIGENQGNITGEGVLEPLHLLLTLFKLRRSEKGVVGGLEASQPQPPSPILLSSSPILLMPIRVWVDTSL
nr:hypothetical protein CFP56_59730 [Quercus suber]